MKLRCREDKDHMLRRLFKRFEERIECRNREHMHLVDDVNAVFQIGRCINDTIAKITNIINAVITCRVHFHDICCRSRLDCKTGGAFSAGVAVFGMLTVCRFCNDLRAGSLTRAARTAEKISVGNLSVFHFARED